MEAGRLGRPGSAGAQPCILINFFPEPILNKCKVRPDPAGNKVKTDQISTWKTYRLLHVKSPVSFLFTGFYYHIANERVFERVSGMVLKTNE